MRSFLVQNSLVFRRLWKSSDLGQLPGRWTSDSRIIGVFWILVRIIEHIIIGTLWGLFIFSYVNWSFTKRKWRRRRIVGSDFSSAKNDSSQLPLCQKCCCHVTCPLSPLPSPCQWVWCGRAWHGFRKALLPSKNKPKKILYGNELLLMSSLAIRPNQKHNFDTWCDNAKVFLVVCIYHWTVVPLKWLGNEA